MTLPSSILGFALVVPITAWSVGLALAAVARRVAAAPLPPEAAARAIVRGMLAGPLVGVLVTGALIAHAALGALLGWSDHCLEHGGGHLHLCFRHGDGWVDRASFAVVLTGAALWASWPPLRLAIERHRVRRALATVHAASRRAAEASDDLDVRLTEGVGPHLFLTCEPVPVLYVAADLWRSLTDEERRAVMAHERAHLDRRDFVWQARLGRITGTLPPGLGAAWLRRWAAEAERACDARAALEVGAPVVASALVTVARHLQGATGATPAGALAFGESSVERRVLSLLAANTPVRRPRPARPGPHRALGWGLAAVVALVAGVDALHHLFETVLGGL